MDFGRPILLMTKLRGSSLVALALDDFSILIFDLDARKTIRKFQNRCRVIDMVGIQNVN
jgi:hypothetical protein